MTELWNRRLWGCIGGVLLGVALSVLVSAAVDYDHYDTVTAEDGSTRVLNTPQILMEEGAPCA